MTGFADCGPVDVIETLVNPLYHELAFLDRGKRFLRWHFLSLDLLQDIEPGFAIGEDLLVRLIGGQVKVAPELLAFSMATVAVLLYERLDVLFESILFE